MMYVLMNIYKDASSIETYHGIRFLHWSDKCYALFYSIGVETLLALDMLALGITVMKTTILRPNSGHGFFAT